MNAGLNPCEQQELLPLHALRALPGSEVPALEAHLAGCAACQRELGEARRVVESFAAWPTDVLRPSLPLWDRLARRIAEEEGTAPVLPAEERWTETDWEAVAPGISCKLLATDENKERVSMLVRLAPGVEYPPHRHAGVEELHLLDGELWIDELKLVPGDYYRAEPGSSDHRVWSETGCTCVLMASPQDVLG
jgi:quercetin dioxygenase-like cupin family protein